MLGARLTKRSKDRLGRGAWWYAVSVTPILQCLQPLLRCSAFFPSVSLDILSAGIGSVLKKDPMVYQVLYGVGHNSLGFFAALDIAKCYV
jgi:hypothetical protein